VFSTPLCGCHCQADTFPGRVIKGLQMTGSPRTMKAAMFHKVMKKKTITSVGARAFGLKGKLLASLAKADALKLKVKKTVLKEKEQEQNKLKKQKEQLKAEVAALKRKEEALLSPEALRERLKLESLVAKDFKEVIKKIVKDDAEEIQRFAKEQVETMDVSEELSEEELTKLNRAVDVAMNIYKDMWIQFVFEYDRTNGDGDEREDRACAFMETLVAERYEDLRIAATNLIPWLPPMQPATEGGDYNVFEVDGYQPPQHLRKGATNWRLLASQYPATGAPALEKVMGASLACFRRDPKFRALEAFSAMMAVISARKEKSFLEVFATQKELESEMKKLQKKGLKVQSKNSAQRKHETRKFLEKQEPFGYGYFAHYLVKPHATMRVAFRPGVPAPMPVSVIAVEHITLFDALGSPDTGDGSFVGVAKSYDWCSQEGTQFTFQAANLGIEEKAKMHKELREPVEGLRPNAELRDLLLSRKNIVYLEVTAALAPRELAKREGLSAIVIAELAKLMRDAKERGEAVLFCLGSDCPHKLAEKVYLRKPIGDHGLRCGYFRWRKSADAPWAREAMWEDRPCHCLQMP